jgi:hypothetical protein
MANLEFLESIGNLKPLVRARIGRTPSTAVAREISTCLQQGRLFYKAASESPIEIRPLQMYYGMVGFAKALILARRLQRLATLPQTHGLRDVSESGCRLSDLRVRIDSTGTFQAFNDAAAKLTRICHFNGSASPAAIYVSSAESSELVGITLSLKEILSRIPGLSDLYRQTFGEDPQCEALSLHDTGQRCELRIDDHELFKDVDHLKNIVEKWRSRFPFLKQWRLHEASHAWGYSVIIFENFPPSELHEFISNGSAGSESYRPPKPTAVEFDFLRSMPPLAGGWTGGLHAIAAFRGIYFSEFSLHCLGLYLLSSLVRYRPDTWVGALSRRAVNGGSADDEVLALVQAFLNVNSSEIPRFINVALNPNEDKFDPSK